jgi:DNA-binding CsgD family transcriptional regulator
VFYYVLTLFFATVSVNAGLLILSILNYKKTREKILREGSLVTASVIVILFADAVKVFGRSPSGAMEPNAPLSAIAISLAGFALFAYSLPLFACRLVRVAMSPVRWVIHGIMIVTLATMGVLNEILALSLSPALEGAAFVLVSIYAALMVIVFFKRIEDKVVRPVVKSFLIILAASIVLAAAQVPLVNLLAIPERWREVPYVQLLYSLSAAALLIFFASRYLYKSEVSVAKSLPRDFVVRFGISQRECDIIALVMQGFSHKQIGGQLYISNRTVKNHIYNIYQKTGAENKVQLLNMIHSDRI